MGFFTPIQQLLPEQIQAIDPAHKETMLGWVTGLGALAAVVINPLAGALSDRTRLRFGRLGGGPGSPGGPGGPGSRAGRGGGRSPGGFLSLVLGRFMGRRHPWTLVGAILGAACLALLATQHTII